MNESYLRFFLHTPLVMLMSGVFVRQWKGVNHFIFFIQCIDFWTKFPYCSPLRWILKVYWGSAIPENRGFSCLCVCLFYFISFGNAQELKKARLIEWNWIVVLCFVAMEMTTGKFIKCIAMHFSDLVQFNSTTTEKFSLWKDNCWFRLPALGNKYWIGCVLNFFNMEKILMRF